MFDHFCRNEWITLYTEQSYPLYQNKVHLPAFGTRITPQVANIHDEDAYPCFV